MGKDQYININVGLEKLFLTPTEDCEWSRTSVEKITADMVERARDLESEVETKDFTELLQFPYKISIDEELFLMDKQ